MAHELASGRAATLIKLGFAALAKVSSAFAAFALTAMVTRNLSADDAGLFLLGFTLVTVFAVVVRFGLDNVVLRFLSAEGPTPFAQDKLNRGLVWVASLAIPVTIIAMAASQVIATYVFNKPDFGPVLFWMLPALPCIAVFTVLSFGFQSQHRVILTTFFQSLGVSALFVLAVLGIWYWAPAELTTLTLAKVYSASAAAVLVLALGLWFLQKGVQFRVAEFRDPELKRAAMHLWVAALMSLSVQWSGVLISGALLPAADVALFSAALRTAMLTSFVLMVVNMVVAPRYARLWKEGNIQRIRYLAKWSARGMVVLVAPVIAVMVIWPEFVMGLFGDGYDDAAILLMVLAVGQFINVATGSVGFLLNMSGHERDYNRVTLFSGPLTIVLAVGLTMQWGVLGTAIATALGVALQNLGAAWMVKRRLGFVPLF